MPAEYFCGSGWWMFPVVMPVVMLLVVLTVLYFVFGRERLKPPWWNESDRQISQGKDSDTAMEILKKRYARGEISKEEFDRMKKDLLS